MVKKDNDKVAWWQPAMVIFSQVSAWIVVPILLALFAGKALDKRYGTDPWIFLGLTAISFIISSVGIVRVTINYTKKIEAEAKQKKEDEKFNNQKTNNSNNE